MSTVIASPLSTFALWLTPWRTTPPDPLALDRVLAKYGLELLPGTHRGLEFIAGDGLEPADAAALAEELRGLGLHARVAPRDDIHSSSRITNAFVAQFFGFVGTIPIALVIVPAMIGFRPNLWAIWALVVSLGLASLTAAISVALRGGNRLEVAAVRPRSSDALASAVAEVRRLAAWLPEHVGTPLLERTRQLAARAHARPNGQAAAELRELAEELTAKHDLHDAAEARALRSELARAQNAVREIEPR